MGRCHLSSHFLCLLLSLHHWSENWGTERPTGRKKHSDCLVHSSSSFSQSREVEMLKRSSITLPAFFFFLFFLLLQNARLPLMCSRAASKSLYTRVGVLSCCCQPGFCLNMHMDVTVGDICEYVAVFFLD